MHALPQGWEDLAYEVFLSKRRRLMASVIRRGFEALADQGDRGPDITPFAAPDEVQVWKRMEELETELRALIHAKYTARWGAAANERMRKVFSAKELADAEVRRDKHAAAYPLSRDEKQADNSFLDYLYVNDLARLVTASETWDQFAPLFQRRKDALTSRLEQITPVRNDRAHHRRVPENELLRCKLACDDLLAMIRRERGPGQDPAESN
jgi:hypothetical protein